MVFFVDVRSQSLKLDVHHRLKLQTRQLTILEPLHRQVIRKIEVWLPDDIKPKEFSWNDELIKCFDGQFKATENLVGLFSQFLRIFSGPFLLLKVFVTEGAFVIPLVDLHGVILTFTLVAVEFIGFGGLNLLVNSLLEFHDPVLQDIHKVGVEGPLDESSGLSDLLLDLLINLLLVQLLPIDLHGKDYFLRKPSSSNLLSLPLTSFAFRSYSLAKVLSSSLL